MHPAARSVQKKVSGVYTPDFLPRLDIRAAMAVEIKARFEFVGKAPFPTLRKVGAVLNGDKVKRYLWHITNEGAIGGVILDHDLSLIHI